MRVLMTGDTLGGVWTYAVALAAELADQGVRVDLAVMGRAPSPRQRAQVAAVSGLRLHAQELRLCWMQDPWDDLARAAGWLSGLAAEIEPDLVHLNDFGHAALDWPVPVLLVGHSCVCSWWRAVRGEEAPPEWDRYRALVRAGLERADLVAAPSGAMRDALSLHYGPIARTRVIPNGLRGPTGGEAPLKAPLVLGAGRLWDEGKNIGALAAAAERLDWPVAVAGEATGPDGARMDLPDLIATGLLDREELDRWYARAAIFALPARYEPFGLGPLEAAQRGCALVLGDIPSLREVWGDAALFVPPDDSTRLRAALELLIAEPDLCRRYAARAHKRARRYSASRMAATYLAAYRELVPGRIQAQSA
jgi:glycogen(starch) synthase